jgi:glycosyltransferase involved in cell wall biosynthesis
MPSIVVFCKTLVRGGAEKQALLLAQLLSEREADVVVISWSRSKIDTQNKKFITENCLKYYGLYGPWLMRFVQFNRILKEENAAIVFSYLTLANIVAGISKVFNKDLVTFGGIRSEKLPVCKFLAERFVHNHLNNATILNNYSAKSKFEKRGFDPGKGYVIHNAIKAPGLSFQLINREELHVITVARFVKAKDFETALLAFNRLVTNNPDRSIRYIIVGYGPEEAEIRSLIASLGLHKKVDIVINPPNVRDYLKASGIYLSTSLFEGLSNSLMEAMVEGLPIVATDVGDNRFLVRDGYNGYLLPVKDVDQIALRLESLMKSAELRHTFGMNSLELITGGFSEEKLLAGYLKLIGQYASVLPQKQVPENEKTYTHSGL